MKTSLTYLATERTLNMLFAAQRQQNPSQPHEMSQPQHHVPVGAQPGPSSSLSPSHQTSLHSFWNLPSRPSASAESLPSITVDTPTECEDCGQNFGGDDDDAMMDVDDISAPEGSSCGACGKHVCSHCSITNIGQQRRCLSCAGTTTRERGGARAANPWARSMSSWLC